MAERAEAAMAACTLLLNYTLQPGQPGAAVEENGSSKAPLLAGALSQLLLLHNHIEQALASLSGADCASGAEEQEQGGVKLGALEEGLSPSNAQQAVRDRAAVAALRDMQAQVGDVRLISIPSSLGVSEASLSQEHLHSALLA